MQKLKIIVEKHFNSYLAYPIGLVGAVVSQGKASEEASSDVQSVIACYVFFSFLQAQDKLLSMV